MQRLLLLLVVCCVGAHSVEGNNYASLEGDTLVKGLGEPLGDYVQEMDDKDDWFGPAGTPKVVKADKEMELGEIEVRPHPPPHFVG